MNKHTSGPWDVHSNLEIHQLSDENGEEVIAEIPDDCPFDTATKEANAKLIAAAPELLNALVKLLACSRQNSFIANFKLEDTPAESMAAEAIKKATGN